jgi:hypothetical protein
MLTERDRLIVAHVERFGFITLSQATELVFNKQKYGYDVCRKRMQKLITSEYLKSILNQDTNEKIFFDASKSIKRMSLHRMVLMNYYVKLIAAGVDLKIFDIEKQWQDGKYRTDAFCVFDFQDFTFCQLIEVHCSPTTSYLNLIRYEKLFETGEVQKICKGYFPTIISIDDVNHKKELNLKHEIKVIRLNFELEGFGRIFL